MTINHERACEQCGGSMEGKRPQATYCGERCKDRARRRRERETGKVTYVRKGRPTTRPTARKYKPGHTFGSLTLAERLGKRNGSLWVVAECECRSLREYNLSNLANGITVNCADREHHPDPRNVGDAAAYSTMHHRLAKLYGPASAHPCFVCGGPAAGWAFLHGTPDIKRDTSGKDAGRPFATDPRQYAPACKPHHRLWDNCQARQAGGSLSLAHRALWLATHGEEVTAA